MSSTRSTDAEDAWRAILVAFTTVHRELAREMHDRCGLPIEDYEILLMLYSQGTDGMRPSDIADQRWLSRSGASRLIDRLEQQGLVERRLCDDDRRGNVVTLTAAGRTTFRTAGRVHLDGIQRHVGARLTATDIADLRRILPKLTAN